MKADCVESEHDYANDCDEMWEIHKEGAKRIAITFSKDTYTESYDYIYIYDANDNKIGRYSGSELAAQTINIPSSIVKIRLTSGFSASYYGFAVTRVEAFYEECQHKNTEVVSKKVASCTEEGYTGDVRCKDCGDIVRTGEILYKLNHQYEDGYCTLCGKMEGLLYTIHAHEVTITGYEGNPTELVIPRMIEGYPVTRIGSSAFADCPSLLKVVLPTTITEIASSAFKDCTNLRYIVIPNSVMTIRSDAFDDCSNLWHVLYTGIEEEWSLIVIGGYNNSLNNATRHYNASSNQISSSITKESTCTDNGTITFNCSICEENCSSDLWSKGHKYEVNAIVEPTCVMAGYTEYKCSTCGHIKQPDYTAEEEHSFIDGICSACETYEADCIESQHPYADDCNYSWTINKEGANKIEITFSRDTFTEARYDFITIYDADGNVFGKYSGDELSSKTICVNSDAVKIRLTSDYRRNAYGFSVRKVKAYYPSCTHENTELQNFSPATLTENGYIGDTVCLDCDETIQTGEVIDKVSDVILITSEYTYTGKTQKPTVTVKDSANRELELDKDYSVEYEAASVDVGTYDVKVIFKGNYKGEKTLPYTIKPMDVTVSANVELAQTEYAYTGAEQRPTVTVKTESGTTLILNKDYTVSYSGKGIELGQYSANITFIGNYSGEKTFNYTVVPNDVTETAKMSLSQTEYTYTGKTQKPTITVKDSANRELELDKDYTVVYEAASVDVGTYDVKVIFKGNYKGKKTLSYTIKSVALSNTAKVTLSKSSYTYNGKVQTPTVTVKDSAGKLLKLNTDYTVTYPSDSKNAGKYNVVVTFKGNYTGTKTLSYTINADKISNTAKVKLSKTTYTYNDKTQKPSVTVKDKAGKTLKLNTDYTVKYASGCKNVGQYKVTVTFKGNYTGTKTLTYTINPKNTKLTSVAKGSKRFTAKWSKQTKEVTGYQIRYSLKKNMSGSKTITVNKTKTTSYTVKKLKANKKYYVQIRTHKKVGGKTYYSSWSSAKTVTTKK